MSKPFPKKLVLWSGAILGGIVNAMLTAKSATYPAFRYWRRNTYVLNGMDGRQGAVTFAGGHWYGDAPVVGAFYDVHGRRLHDDAALLEHCFRGCPAYQRSLAEGGALRFLLFEGPRDVRATSAFWDDGDYLCASDPWEVQLANGVDLIATELIDPCAADGEFGEDCQLSEEQIAFARSVFERKIARPAGYLELTPLEVGWLESTFEDHKVRYAELYRLRCGEKREEGAEASKGRWWESIDSAAEAQKAMKECREMFAEMGIDLPDKRA